MMVKFDVGFGKFFCKKPAVIWYKNLISSVYYIFMYFSKTYISITYFYMKIKNPCQGVIYISKITFPQFPH